MISRKSTAVLALGFILVAGTLADKSDGIYAQKPKPEDHARALARGVAVLEIRALRESMRDPESFAPIKAFGNAAASRLCVLYRGRNGFGGMTIEEARLRGGRWQQVTHCHIDRSYDYLASATFD
jgi:hypothetical protein